MPDRVSLTPAETAFLTSPAAFNAVAGLDLTDRNLTGLALGKLHSQGRTWTNVTARRVEFEELSFDAGSWHGATFRQCTLRKVRFRAVRFVRCVWDETAFEGVSFEGCKFEDCIWSVAQLRSVRFSHSTFERGRLLSSDIEDVLFDGCTLHKLKIAILQANRAHFRGTQLTECQLERVAWTDSEWSESRFVGCELSQASFSDAKLGALTFERCSAQSISFGACEASSVTFTNCPVLYPLTLSNCRWQELMIRFCDVWLEASGSQFRLQVHDSTLSEFGFDGCELWADTRIERSSVTYGGSIKDTRCDGMAWVDCELAQVLYLTAARFVRLDLERVRYTDTFGVAAQDVEYDLDSQRFQGT